MSDTTANLEKRLDENQAERLSLVRYQLLLSEEQARLPPPLNTLALSQAHDALETLLHVAAVAQLVDLKAKWTFDDLVIGVANSTTEPSMLTRHRVALKALNEARVSYKHHGNRIDPTTLKGHLVTAQAFATDAVQVIFGRKLSDIDLITFIAYAPSREQLHEAERAAQRGDYQEAMCQIRLAFDGLVRDYTGRKREYVGRSVFETRPSFLPSNRDLRANGLEKIVEWLESIDEYLVHLAVGVDMRRYAYLQAYTPKVYYMLNGGHKFVLQPGMQFDDEMYQRCLRFVLDTGLSFIRDDFDFDSHERRVSATRTEEMAAD